MKKKEEERGMEIWNDLSCYDHDFSIAVAGLAMMKMEWQRKEVNVQQTEMKRTQECVW